MVLSTLYNYSQYRDDVVLLLTFGKFNHQRRIFCLNGPVYRSRLPLHIVHRQTYLDIWRREAIAVQCYSEVPHEEDAQGFKLKDI